MDFASKSRMEKENEYLHGRLSKLREQVSLLTKNNRDLREKVERLEGELADATGGS